MEQYIVSARKYRPATFDQVVGQHALASTLKNAIATDRLDGGCSDPKRVWYHVNDGAALEVQENATDFFMQGVTIDNENWTIQGME